MGIILPGRRLYPLRNFNKTNVLDQCIDGDVDKFNELLDSAFDHFNIFFQLCKESLGSKNIDSVKYDGMNDGSATFNVACDEKSIESELSVLSKHKVVNHLIHYEKTKSGVSVNILIKE